MQWKFAFSFHHPPIQWLNFIKSRLSNTFAVLQCVPDSRIPWKERGYTINENFRGSRDTKRENCDRNPGTERFMSLLCECVWYTPWSWSCRICLNDIALLRICALQIFHIKPRQSFFFFESFHISKLFGRLIFKTDIVNKRLQYTKLLSRLYIRWNWLADR